MSYGLYVTSTEPTRGKSCLDTVCTDLKVWDYEVKVTNPDVSDHCVLIIRVNTSILVMVCFRFCLLLNAEKLCPITSM